MSWCLVGSEMCIRDRALGLAAHAIGTAQAWQRGSIAGRYAAFGMAVNAVFTAVWLPTFILYLQKM
jgi:putative effector of murein hydrolase